MIIFPVIMFVLGVGVAGLGVLLLATGLTNALLAFLISAVLCTGAFIIGAIMDLEKTIAAQVSNLRASVNSKLGKVAPPSANPPPVPR